MPQEPTQLKKKTYRVLNPLREHLTHYGRAAELPITYSDLMRYTDLIAITDEDGEDTLWYSAMYSMDDLKNLWEQLIDVYELLVSDGQEIGYLKIASIEFCSFGNSRPFRIKVRNEINDNHDYFYVKQADASRIYGLELEEIFSPDKVSFLVGGDTLIEEHIVGIPCDNFIMRNRQVEIANRLRFSKEFVKFNERCFTRLLGDMRAYNFVVEIIQDFDNVQYRLRPIDFDQQNYEGRMRLYLPQFFKDNYDLVQVSQELMSTDMAKQYAREERVAMKKRFTSRKTRTRSLLRKMRKQELSTRAHIAKLRSELARHHKDERFESAKSMGDILILQLEVQLGISIFQ